MDSTSPERQPTELGEPPRKLGPYAIVRRLGRGGMATVYEAVHTGLGKRVALKVLNGFLQDDETVRARFVREGRIAAKVQHPGVVDVYDVGAQGDVAYLAMEFLEGVDLGTHLERVGRMSAREAVDLVLPVIAAVAAAHEAGIVHRDIKPTNVFLSKDRHGEIHPKLLDFGISAFLEREGEAELTATDALLGTVKYMPPEQTRGAKYADARSDQYALAVLLYVCTTGSVPFLGDGAFETISAIRSAPFVPPSARAPDLPPALDAVIGRALRRAAHERFPSVAEFGVALLPFGSESSSRWRTELGARDVPAITASLAPPTEPTPPSLLKRRAPYALALLGLLTVVAFASYEWKATSARAPSAIPAVSETPTVEAPAIVPPLTASASSSASPSTVPTPLHSSPVVLRHSAPIRSSAGPATQPSGRVGRNDAPILE